MGAEQEVSFRQLVAAATSADLRALIDPAAASLLETLRPEMLAGEHLVRLVTGGGSARTYLLDPTSRANVLKLLTPKQARLLATRLGLADASDHPHTTLREAADQLSAEQLTSVLAFFGADAADDSVGIQNTPVKQPAEAGYPLFDYQRDVLRRVQQRLYDGSHRVVLHMPTGAGKTRTAMNAIVEHLRRREPTVVIWLAYSAELLEQAASEFEIAWRYIGNRRLDVVRFWGGRSFDLTTVHDGLVVAGLGKMHAAGERDLMLLPKLGDATSLVVMDEAHQSIAETYAFVLDILATKKPSTSLLGLTATPGRTYSDIEEDTKLSAFWRGEKVMLEIKGYNNPVTGLIENGYLARPEFRTILIDTGMKPSDRDLERMRQNLELPQAAVDQLAEDEKWNTAVIEAASNLVSRHRRVIVFSTSVRQAVVLAAVLRALGHNARAVTGITPKPERESILQQFTSNSAEAMVLFNYGVLTAGFDAPATSAALIARPTRSLVLFSQMVGRAVRGPRAGGNATAEIVTVIDPKLPGFGDPAQAFTNWEDVW
jgi:superfamily II DNA or RNA helicase